MTSCYITVRTTKTGKRFVVRYRLGGRNHRLIHGGSFKTHRDARARRDLIAGELANGRDPRIVLAQLAAPVEQATLASAFDAWVLSRHDVGEKHRAEYRHPRRHIIDFFGADTDPAAITVAKVREFVGHLAAGYKPSTVRSYFGPLQMLLDFAEIQPNPARHATVKLPTRQKAEPIIMTLRQFRAMLAALPEKYVLPLRLVEATAIRVGELVKLEWGDIDVYESRLRISVKRTKGRTAGQRGVQVPRALMDEIDALLPLEDRVVGRRVFARVPSEGATKNAMVRACVSAGIPSFSPHDLRHRRASLWHAQGVPGRVVQDRVGHSDLSTTQDIYTHLVVDPRDDEWADAREAPVRSATDPRGGNPHGD